MAKRKTPKQGSEAEQQSVSEALNDSAIPDAVVVEEEPGEKPEQSVTSDTENKGLGDTPEGEAPTAETPGDTAAPETGEETAGAAPPAAEAAPEAAAAETADHATAAEVSDKSDTDDSLTEAAGHVAADQPDTPLTEAAETVSADPEPAPEAAPEARTDTGESQPAPESAAPPSAPAPQVIEKVVEKKGGFVPMVLGGIVAAGIGFGFAQYTGADLFGGDPAPNPFEAETRAALEAQVGATEALAVRIDTVEGAVNAIDLGTVESAVAAQAAAREALATEIGARIDEIAAQAAQFDERLTALEKRPVAEAVSPEAIAAYERELEELRTAITTQRSEIEAMAAEAVAAQQDAAAQAGLSLARAALAEVTAAVESGAPFAEALATIGANSSAALPAALSATAAEGVPTLRSLADAFPDLARDALTVARRSATASDEGGNRFAAFLQNQLGARSVTPRDGDDPDAVLSRAEAAVRGGELSAALAEIEALPEDAKAVLAGWRDVAQTRLDAVTALDALTQQLNQE